MYCNQEHKTDCIKLFSQTKTTWTILNEPEIINIIEQAILDFITEYPSKAEKKLIQQQTKKWLKQRNFENLTATKLISVCLNNLKTKKIATLDKLHITANSDMCKESIERTRWTRTCWTLLNNIKLHKEELELLQKKATSYFVIDTFYRFYHKSFKVYQLQQLTEEIVIALKGLLPDHTINTQFNNIIQTGTRITWKLEHNKDWSIHTKPILEAFFHARTMLEATISSGKKLKEPTNMLPSDWATVLYLFNIR